LKVEAATWLEDGSCVCDQCPGEDEHVLQNEVHALLYSQDHRVCELRKHFSFPFTPFLRIFQQPNPFCCNMSTANLFMISFLSRTIDFFFFSLSLWIYLWLAETSQQPISQTTWLKVTPHCNHCNHFLQLPTSACTSTGMHPVYLVGSLSESSSRDLGGLCVATFLLRQEYGLKL